MEQFNQFIKETIDEVRYRVTWPTFSELQKQTAAVLLGSLAFAGVVGLMDVAFDKALSLFYTSF